MRPFVILRGNKVDVSELIKLSVRCDFFFFFFTGLDFFVSQGQKKKEKKNQKTVTDVSGKRCLQRFVQINLMTCQCFD